MGAGKIGSSMAGEVFREAVAGVLADEGGAVHDPDDPGGETKYGISKRSYPAVDIASLTKEQAIAIYHRDWWDAYGLERLVAVDRPACAGKLLNLGVNMGMTHAVRCLQRAVRACQQPVKEDGLLGTQTINALTYAPEASVLAAFRSEAAGHYRLLMATVPKLRKYETGWLGRAYR